jgi:hypothetical protein
LSRRAKISRALGALAILVTLIGIAVSIYVPEVRRWVGLEGAPYPPDSRESSGGPSIDLPDGTRIKAEKGGSVKYIGKGERVERRATTMTSIFGEHKGNVYKRERTDPNIQIKPSPGDD